MTRESLFNDIWRACDIMRRDDGTTGILEYMEQLSWMLFLKAFEAIESRYETEASVYGKSYDRIFHNGFRWSEWTRRDTSEIIDFVNNQLFPYLRELISTPEKAIIATIFKEIPYNRMKSPYNFKDVIDIINEIDFNAPEDSHIVSMAYEDLLLRMGREGGIAGEFYTPRPIVRFMVMIVNPEIGERVLDPFCGSSGFLVESFKRMKESKELTVDEFERLQRETFYGHEKKSLPYLIAMMNCILHELLTPNILHKNTLEENIRNIPDAQRFDVILTNPPFGGKEGGHIQQNFPIQSQATELLSLQHVMKKLKMGGRCGIVVPEGILFRGDAFALVKKELLENYNLHTIVSLPSGVFANVASSGQGPKTNLLFFNRSGPTKEVWYYELTPPPGVKYTKTSPIKDEHLSDAYEKWKTKSISENSWIEPVESIVKRGYDLTAKNPNRADDHEHRSPEDLVAGVLAKERRIAEILGEIHEILNSELGQKEEENADRD